MGKKFKLSRTNQYYHHFLVGFFVFMVSFVVTGLVSSVFTPVGETSAQTISVENRATGYYVAVTSPDSVSLDVTPTPSGKSVVGTANVVNVKTNAPLGYKLYLSTEDDELKSSNTDISQTFTPVTSSSLSVNTWGFSKTGADNSWLAVPEVTSGKESTGYLLSSATAPNTPNGDNISVYYGVNSDTSMPAGTYTTTVTYTAIGDGIPEEHTMQEFTMSECINMPVDQTFYLIDSRNNKIYSIIHAKDGNCWMTENLKYQNVESSNWNTNDYSQELLHIGTGEGYKGEYFYNYTSAINVCPTGWKLPTGLDATNNGSWAKLINAYSVTTGAQLMDASDPAYVLGLHEHYGNWDWYNASESNHGDMGVFWSSTAETEISAYTLYYDSTSINPRGGHTSGNGYTVRCVFSSTMQEFSATDCANINTDTQFTLTDSRNNKEYKVVKARDGNCWMADNLAIYNQTISSADSDLPAGTTIALPASETWNTNVANAMKIHVADGTGNNADKTGEYYGEVYYNWVAAIADSTISSVEVDQSICPKGWRLPSAKSEATDKTFTRLLKTYGISSDTELLAQTDLGFTKHYGMWYWESNSEYGQGATGRFWSSTSGGGSNAYFLRYDVNGFGGGYYGSRSLGNTIRCVLR